MPVIRAEAATLRNAGESEGCIKRLSFGKPRYASGEKFNRQQAIKI